MPRRRGAVAAAILGLLWVLAGLLAGCGGDDDGGEIGVSQPEAGQAADYQYTITEGTGEAMDRGDQVEILPAELTVQVGEVLEIVNQDDRGHLVGPFFVGAGETLRQEFTSPGEFQGICTVHPSGQFVLTVT